MSLDAQPGSVGEDKQTVRMLKSLTPMPVLSSRSALQTQAGRASALSGPESVTWLW